MYLWRTRNVDGSPLEYGLPYEDLYFVTDKDNEPDGKPKTLNAWFVKQRGFRHCPTLIFLHGNAGNIGDRLQNVYGLYENVQCNVFLVDYRGYGRSEDAKPDEQGLLADAEASLNYLINRKDIDAGQLFIFGRSLGGAVAIGLVSMLAEQKPEVCKKIRGVILENTFTSVAEMTQALWQPLGYIKHFFEGQWGSVDRVGAITCPLLFVSGLADELVPPPMMQELFDGAKKSQVKHMVRFPYGTHNETWCEGGYYQHILLFMKKLYLDKKEEASRTRSSRSSGKGQQAGQ